MEDCRSREGDQEGKKKSRKPKPTGVAAGTHAYAVDTVGGGGGSGLTTGASAGAVLLRCVKRFASSSAAVLSFYGAGETLPVMFISS